jgi:hypothetical protein
MQLAFLEVISGPDKARGVFLPPGEIIRVGSAASAQFSLYNDPTVSPLHCSLMFDGSSVQLLTRLALQPTQSGTRFKVGETDLAIRILDTNDPHLLEDKFSPLETLAEFLHSLPGHTYAVVDSALASAELSILREAGAHVECLLDGDAAIELASAAPYLVELERNPSLLEAALRLVWSNECAIFFQSEADCVEVRKHLRTITMADSPDGISFFRFYDPRVFSELAPRCNSGELTRIMGPATAILCAGNKSHAMVLLCETAGQSKIPTSSLHHFDLAVVSVEESALADCGLLTLTANHLGAFQALANEAFLRRLGAHIRQNIPSVRLSEIQLTATLREYTHIAKSHGARSEKGIAVFACLCFLPGQPFFELDPVKEYLMNGRGSVDQKLEALSTRLARNQQEPTRG